MNGIARLDLSRPAPVPRGRALTPSRLGAGARVGQNRGPASRQRTRRRRGSNLKTVLRALLEVQLNNNNTPRFPFPKFYEKFEEVTPAGNRKTYERASDATPIEHKAKFGKVCLYLFI